MKLSHGAKSLSLFALSVLFLVLLTLFDSSLSGLSPAMQRTASSFFLVAPGSVGVVLGVLSILRNEPRRWMAYLGIAINVLFVLFHVFVLSFAG
jgi:hypothetical protein